VKKEIIIFIISFLGMAICYNYPAILTKKNGSIHQWRQADCLSITQNYYKENLAFHQPKIHHMSDETGLRGVASEFPILYYLVGNIWKITGQKEWIFRLINVVISFLGLFYLFKLFYALFTRLFPALFLSFLLFTSPIYIYYTNNFLADATALNIVFIGWYWFYKFYNSHTNKHLFLVIVFFLLAGLIKISSLFSLFALAGIAGFELFGFIKFKEVRLFKPIHFLYFLIPLLCIASWYIYAIQYSESNGNSYVFLKGILPIWELSGQRITETFSQFISVQAPRIFNSGIHITTGILFIANVWNMKRINSFVISLNILLFLGVSFFFLLFYQVFDIHDYYLINSLIFYLVTWFTFFLFLYQNTNLFDKRWCNYSLVGVLLYLVFIGSVHVRHRYNTTDPIAFAGYDYISQHDKDVFGWYQFEYKKNQQAYEDITPYLRSIGIKREDVVMVLGDVSINISLYNMDQIGFTNYCNVHEYENQWELAKSFGAQYLFVSEYKKEGFSDYLPYMKNEIGKFRNILIYSAEQ